MSFLLGKRALALNRKKAQCYNPVKGAAMVTVKLSTDYGLIIPAEFRRWLAGEQELAISVDAQGRLILTPVEHVRARLLETFGMWRDRADIPSDGVEAMDELRAPEAWLARVGAPTDA